MKIEASTYLFLLMVSTFLIIGSCQSPNSDLLSEKDLKPDLNQLIKENTYQQKQLTRETNKSEQSKGENNTIDIQPKVQNKRRVLLGSPIRITVDASGLAGIGNANAIAFLEEASSAATSFFQTVISVNPLATNNKYPSAGTCGSFPVPSADINTGIANSDLHVYVNYVGSGSQKATGKYCIMHSGNNGPKFANLEWNWGAYSSLTFPNTDPSVMQKAVKVAMHEMMHILGFSVSMMGMWQDGAGASYPPNTVYDNTLTYRGITPSAILQTPKVVAAGATYFSCGGLVGVPLENQGSSADQVNHWEQTVLHGDLMTAGFEDSDAVFSALDIAVLQDTGFYTGVDTTKAQPLFFGKGRGCTFVTDNCNTGFTPEYCAGIANDSCNFNNQQKGICSNSNIYLDQPACAITGDGGTEDCTNPNSTNADVATTQEVFGSSSRCFDTTTLVTSGASPNSLRCYPAVCDVGNAVITITINSVVRTCSSNNAVINFSGFTGSLQCPANISTFCQQIKTCPNDCSNHGVCLKGVCTCSIGWSTSNCSVPICHYSCATCDGPKKINCLTCTAVASNQRIAAPVAGECTCVTQFYDDGVNLACQPCSIYCDDCTGPSETECQTCRPYALTFRNLNGSMCGCDLGKYNVVGDPICGKCHASCLGCSEGTKNDCTLCIDLSANDRVDKLTTTGVPKCPCKPYYFSPLEDDLVSPDPKCQPCDPTCLSCSALTANDCLTCDAAKFRIISGTTCICQDGYFLNASTGNCDKCHYSCQTCNSAGALACLTCETLSLRLDPPTGGQCLCQDTQYDDGTNQLCQPCHYSCNFCNGSGPTKCTSCPAATFRDDQTATSSSCPCTIGYYDNLVALCVACDPTCATCTGTLATQCLTCYTVTQFRSLNVSTCNCKEGYYDSGAVDQICLPCHYSCSTCNNSNANNQCKTCPSGSNFRVSNIDGGTGLGTCPCMDGYWDNGVMACPACHHSCNKCTAGNAINQCTDCNINNTNRAALTAGTCPCETGFVDAGTMICTTCHYSCLTCSITFNSCDTCEAANQRIQSGKTCPCNDGYYDDGNNGLCKKCHHSCYTCKGPLQDDCLSCPNSNPSQRTTLVQGTPSQMSCPCMNYFYDNGSNQICQPCHYTCLTCLGKENYECSTCDAVNSRVFGNYYCNCKTGTVDVGVATCSGCHSSCFKCSGVGDALCTECPDPVTSFRLNTISTDGQCPCQPGYYHVALASICGKCDVSCLTCFDGGINKCNDCPASSFRTFDPLNNTCLCNPGYYSDNTAICKLCHYTCITCKGPNPTDCLTCNNAVSNFRLNTGPSNNVCPCMPGYYDTGILLCSKCHYTCAECLGGNQETMCTKCDPLSFRGTTPVGGKCLCSDYYYDTGALMCSKCHWSCKNCMGSAATQCSKCETDTATYHRIDKSNVNFTCPCQENYFEIPNTNACGLCNITCKSCIATGANMCSECYTDAFRTNLATPTGGSCPCQINYNETNERNCVRCHPTCASCSQFVVANACLSCTTGLFRNTIPNINQECTCISGKYNDPNTPICQPCHYSCSNCTGPYDSQCTSCPPSSFRTQSGTTCPCNPGYYDDGTTVCKNCNPVCLECQDGGVTSCSQCAPGYYLNGTTCLVCSTLCLTCVDLPDQCLTCQAGTALVDTKCYTTTCDVSCKTCYSQQNLNCITCSSSYYRNATTGQCNKCDANCLECTGPNSDNCTQCFNGLNLQPNSSCCHATCLTCKGVTSTECLSCDYGYFLLNGECQDLCPDTYYANSFRNICEKCDTSCLTCVDSGTNCKACSAGYKIDPTSLNPGTCRQEGCTNPLCKTCTIGSGTTTTVTSTAASTSISSTTSQVATTSIYSTPCGICIAGYYKDDLNVCQTCDWCCSSCKSAGASSCSECPSGFELSQGDTLISDGVCVPQCHTNCRTCNGVDFNSCTSCLPNQYLLQNECVGSCPDFYYPDPVKLECYSCAVERDGCQSCSERSCLRCKAGYTLNPTTGNCYLNGCDPTCVDCSEKGQATSCAKCGVNYFKDADSSCKACIKNCRVCSSEATCDRCESGFQWNSNNQTCDPITCIAENCEICSTDTTKCSCSLCKSGFILLGKVCVANCPSKGFYKSANGVYCLSCSPECETCSTLGTCTTCKEPTKFQLSKDGLCLSQTCHPSCQRCSDTSLAENQCTICFDGYYLTSDNQCLACSQSCLTCNQSSDTCTACIQGQALISGKCQTNCPYGCTTCSSDAKAVCQLCSQGFILDRGYCQVSCESGYFVQSTQSQLECVKCSSNCLTCQTTQDQCLSCTDTQIYRLNASNECELIPPPQIGCHFSCLTCAGTHFSDCYTCPVHRKLYTKEKLTTGECRCDLDYVEDFVQECRYDPKAQQMSTGVAATFGLSTSIGTVLSIAALNPVGIMMTLNTASDLSRLGFINRKQTNGLDTTTKTLSYSNLNTIFGEPKNLDKRESQNPSSRLRTLVQITNSTTQTLTTNTVTEVPPEKNEQIMMNGQSGLFLISGMSMMVLHFIIWLITIFMKQLSEGTPNNPMLVQIKNVMVWSLPIGVYIVTAGEFSLIIFFHFYFYDSDSSLTGVSIFFGIVSLIYFLIMLVYIVYSINFRKFSTPEDQEKVQILIVFFKQNNILALNYFVVLLARKILSSMVLVFGYSSPKGQIACIFLLYFLYVFYVILVRPFEQRKFMFMAIFTEVLMLLIHFVFLLMVTDDDSRKQDDYSSAILALMVVLFLTQFLFAIVQFVIVVYSIITQSKETKKQSDSNAPQAEHVPIPDEVTNNSNYWDAQNYGTGSQPNYYNTSQADLPSQSEEGSKQNLKVFPLSNTKGNDDYEFNDQLKYGGAYANPIEKGAYSNNNGNKKTNNNNRNYGNNYNPVNNQYSNENSVQNSNVTSPVNNSKVQQKQFPSSSSPVNNPYAAQSNQYRNSPEWNDYNNNNNVNREKVSDSPPSAMMGRSGGFQPAGYQNNNDLIPTNPYNQNTQSNQNSQQQPPLPNNQVGNQVSKINDPAEGISFNFDDDGTNHNGGNKVGFPNQGPSSTTSSWQPASPGQKSRGNPVNKRLENAGTRVLDRPQNNFVNAPESNNAQNRVGGDTKKNQTDNILTFDDDELDIKAYSKLAPKSKKNTRMTKSVFNEEN